jgi:monoamine oxidase
MRIRGEGAAARAIRRAIEASRYARATGCGIDEADEIVGENSRRRFLQAAGVVMTSAAVPASLVSSGNRNLDAAAPRVVVVGAGMAGLGCAYKLWSKYQIKADVYEYNTIPGGRIRTLRDYFGDGQLVEEHAEFINPEHTETLALAKSFGCTLDNTENYPPGTHPDAETMRFFGHRWSQAALNADWHQWGWKLFHDAAFDKAPWPVLYDDYTPGSLEFDRMSVPEWIEKYVPGGTSSDFGALCVSAVLDEFGGPPEETSALNLVFLLGQDDSTKNGFQPKKTPALGGANEKWHIHGGNDRLIWGVIDRLPTGALNLGHKLVALGNSTSGAGYVCTFESGTSTREVTADHVVLAIPFTTLRQVYLKPVSDTISPLHMRAINEEPLGTNSKFFVQCSTRVWNEPDRATGNAYCDGVVQGAWDATVYQPGIQGVLAALPGGTLCEDWGRRFGLNSYLGKPPAHMLNAYLAEFDRLFPGVADSYNGRSYFVWSPGDPHILGAYSYLKVGQFTAFNGIQPRQEGNLHFAGEQTSINFQGYIEGALRSGYRCAQEIGGPS